MSGTAAAAPDTTDLEPLYRQLLQQTLAPPAAPAPQGPSPSSHEGRGWLSLLGEALGGGQEYGTTAERETGGIRALGALGQRMLAASDYSYQPHTLGSIIGQGMGAASESLAQTGSVDAARVQALQDYQDKQQTMQLARVKEAIPILTALQAQQRLKAASDIALGKTPGTTPGTSLALTGDLEKDRAIIAQRESGGDPTALNYVARADPTAYDRGATASGKYQFVNSTWQEGLKLAGLDGSKYPTARDAPESVQDQVFTAVYKKHGTAPWDPSAWKSNWVKDPATGKYNLVQGAPYQPPPGKGTSATASTAPPAGSTAAVTGDPTKPELAPGPPGSTGGAPIGIGATFAPGGALSPVAPHPGGPQYTVAPPPQIKAQPIPAGRTTAENVQADVEAMQAGRQIAQTTPAAPGVLAAGPAAPTGGFTAGAGSYGTTAGPAPVAPPQAPPQGPPAAVVPPAAQAPQATPALPPGATPEPPPFAYQRQPLPPDIQHRIDAPLSAEQLAPYQQAIQQAVAGGDMTALQKATADRNTAIAQAAEKAREAGEAWQQNERNKQQEVWQKRWDAWNTNTQQTQQNQQKFENDLRLKQQEMENTLRVNKEAVFNTANQKGLEAAQTEQLAARNSVAQLEAFRDVSNAVKQPNWLQTTKWPGSNHSIAEQLQQAGIPVEDTGGVQLLQGAMTNLTRQLREGMPMGALSDRDLDFIQRMGPTEWMDPETRLAAVDYLQRAFRAKQRFASDVQKEMSRGKNYGDAVDAADAKQPKSFVPTVDAALSARWRSMDDESVRLRKEWAARENVRPGTLIHLNDGTMVIMRSKPQEQK